MSPERPHVKLHVLLKDALQALDRRAADPRYVIDMDEWLVVQDGVCRVCLAGALFADKLAYGDDEYVVVPGDSGTIGEWEADTLEQLRKGLLPYGIEYKTEGRLVEEYDESPARWRYDMNILLRDLKANDE